MNKIIMMGYLLSITIENQQSKNNLDKLRYVDMEFYFFRLKKKQFQRFETEL